MNVEREHHTLNGVEVTYSWCDLSPRGRGYDHEGYGRIVSVVHEVLHACDAWHLFDMFDIDTMRAVFDSFGVQWRTPP